MLWSRVKKFSYAWEHVKVVLTGEKDYVRCRRCYEVEPLANDYRTKQQVHLEFAKRHFYRCVEPVTALPEQRAAAVVVMEESLYA